MLLSDEILNNTKLLLGLNGEEKDDILRFIINDCISAITAYCRIDSLPQELIGTAAYMTVKEYRKNGYGSEEEPRDIKTISEGDRSVSFEKRTGSGGIISGFEKRLAPYVKRPGRVPSDLDKKELSCYE